MKQLGGFEMKVFLSWSGAVSHSVALAFRGWLPSVIQSLEPYVSSEDIDKGARWSAEMAQELEKSRYGIVCLTKENVNKPWINFEAGALSKSIEKTTGVPFSSAVSPFLFGLTSTDFEGPLTQFQYVQNDKSDILKLVSSINGKVEGNPLPTEQLEKAFTKWWPDLESALAKIATEGVVDKKSATSTRKPEEILNELLELVRAQQRLMLSKDDIVPALTLIREEISQLFRQPLAYVTYGSGRSGLLGGDVHGLGTTAVPFSSSGSGVANMVTVGPMDSVPFSSSVSSVAPNTVTMGPIDAVPKVAAKDKPPDDLQDRKKK
jgi:hypothetical protein